ncbi:MAG: ParB/RepB/Spo0J family partition protein [bacterium]|jgi:ParB family chromosome partitioning protein
MAKKANTKRGLGKGLQALFSENESVQEDGVIEIRVSDIRPNKFQPRQEFSEDKLEELARSISLHGVLQPVVVRDVIGGYELVAGERRWRACKLAGLEIIPAIIRDFSDSEMMEIALIENLQREDLNPLEEAAAYRRLLDEFGLTQEELSQRIGKSRSHIANILRLLQLPPEIQDYVSRGTISMGHARTLLGLEKAAQQLEACGLVVERGLSVRETEALVQRLKAGNRSRKERPVEKEPYIMALESSLQENLGTKVQIRPGKQKGRIEIEYYTEDDLERICRLLGISFS